MIPNEAAYIDRLFKLRVVHEVHVSERKSFRGCRRRWDWIYRENYYPTTTPKPLEFGIAYHKAMEAIHDPSTWKFPLSVLCALGEKAFVEECETQRKQYLHYKDVYGLENVEQEDYDERIRIGRGMIRYYIYNQLEALREEYTPSHVEVSFDVLLEDENGDQVYCKCKGCRKSFARAGGSKQLGRWYGNPVTISGRVDMVVYDRQGNYWLWDFKTAARLSQEEVFLELDDQVATYCWAVRQGLGLNIIGFLYHEQRKEFPEPPKENKNIRLGRRFSVAANQATDYDIYLETVRTRDSAAYEGGLYDDFLFNLKEVGIKYYARFKVFKTDYEMYRTHVDLLEEVYDFIDPNLRVYPSPGRFACRGCAFQVPCISKNRGQDYTYTLQTLYVQQEPYYRRKVKPSTDKTGD